MSHYSRALWHPFANPNEVDAGAPLHIVSGDGAYVKDDKGRTLLDGNAGGLWCVNVGHNRPEIKAAIAKQLEELVFYQIFNGVTHPRVVELAEKLVEISAAERIKRVFFTNGGSDSIETAFKLARQFHIINGEPERKKVFSLKGAYHGSHFAASTLCGLTGMHRPYGPMVPGVLNVDMPFRYRNPWKCEDPEKLVTLCIDQLVAEIEYQAPDTVAAIVAEAVNGANLVVPPASYWPRLREVCDRYGILLIADEVITGFGRSGALFGCRGWGVVPDMMCTAKGLSSGYVPIGAVLIGERVAEVWTAAGIDAKASILTGVTYAGHPVACAASLAALDIVQRENLPENARVQGDNLLGRLKTFVDRFKSVGDVRGKGLMITLDFVTDRKTRESVDPAFATHVAAVARDNGVLVRPYGSRIILSPALIFTAQHCNQLADALEKTLEQVDTAKWPRSVTTDQ
jgi:putrescine---pyruvate transaminase